VVATVIASNVRSLLRLTAVLLPGQRSDAGFGAAAPHSRIREPTRHAVQEVVVGRLLRKHLVGVQDPERVHQFLQLVHQRHRFHAVFGLGVVALESPQPVFGGDASAELQCVTEDMGRRPADQRPLLVIEDDRRVQVAVPGMADDADLELRLGCQPADPGDHLGNERLRPPRSSCAASP
jgi:hypothetical protein